MADAIRQARVRIECDGLPPDTEVVEMEGREAIHELFAFDLLVAMSNQSGVDPSEVIGSKAKLIIESEVEPGRIAPHRTIHGILSACDDRLDTNTSRSYHLRLVPRFWMSTLVETLEIYQEMSVPDIIKAKLEALHMVEGTDFEFRFDQSYPPREFVVQYKETDHAFISRLCEHLGISYFFDTHEDVDRVVFTDAAWGFSPIEGDELPFVADGETAGVYDLKREASIQPSTFIQRDYNYRNPGTDLLVEDSYEGFGGGIVEYGSHFKDPGQGKFYATIRRQERECRQLIYRGKAADPRPHAGAKMGITGHTYGDVTVLPFAVRHRVRQTAFGRGTGEAEGYETSFEAIDANLTYRPERKTPRPKITGVVTGIIDSAGPGEYADVDELGRYRVRFMFDTSGPQEGKASRPVRMMQPHSGGGYGMHFPLRRGIEVLITFLDGDPDRPIIAGTVPNPQTPSPVASGNAQRNILRTGAGNEINIDDTAGMERVKITVPHGNTLFQLGAPNFAESGAALQTQGAWTTSATSGMAGFTSFKTALTALSDLREGGNIVTKAKKPSKPAQALLVGSILAEITKMAAAAVGTAKAVIEALEKGEKQEGIKAQDAATAIYNACEKCQEELKKAEEGLPGDLKADAEAARQSRATAQDAHGESLDARRIRDSAREANVGAWNDQNEVAHRHRVVKKEQAYSHEPQLDANGELAKDENGEVIDAGGKKEQAERATKQADQDQAALEKSMRDALGSDDYSDDEKEAIRNYLATAGSCGVDHDGEHVGCSGLNDAQQTADERMEEYHDLRSENSDAHASLGKWQQRLTMAATAVSAVTSLVSQVMAIYAEARLIKDMAQEKKESLGAIRRYKRAIAQRRKDRKADPEMKIPLQKPFHYLGAEGTTAIASDSNVIVEAPIVTTHGTWVGVSAREAALVAEKHVAVTAGDDLTIKGSFIDVLAERGKGKFRLEAEKLATFGAGQKDPDPELEMKDDGDVSLKTHDWSMEVSGKKKKKLRMGHKTRPYIEMKEDAEQGELKAKKWHIYGDETTFKVSPKSIYGEAPGGIQLKTDEQFFAEGKTIYLKGSTDATVKAPKFVYKGSTIDFKSKGKVAVTGSKLDFG